MRTKILTLRIENIKARHLPLRLAAGALMIARIKGLLIMIFLKLYRQNIMYSVKL